MVVDSVMIPIHLSIELTMIDPDNGVFFGLLVEEVPQ